MKKFLCLVLALIFMLSFVSCSDDSGETSLEDAYKQAAQKFIDSGDTESAKKALEEGVSATNSEVLKTMLAELSGGNEAGAEPAVSAESSTTASAPSKPDYSKYVGNWEGGSASMEISSSNPDALDFSIFITADNMHIINIEFSVLTSTISNNVATVAYKDTWDNSGTAVVTFKDTQILFETKNSSSGAENMSFALTKSGAGSGSSDSNLIDNMDTAAQTKLNAFLSTFSELEFYEYPTSNERLIDFAFFYNLINDNQKIISTDSEMGIKASDADTTLNYFFGRSVPHSSAGFWTYHDDGFYGDAGFGGGGYTCFSIAKDMKKNSDDTYTVEFDVFYDSTFDFQTEWYSLTTAQAVARFSYSKSGTAVVKEKTHNGNTVYELVSFTAK